MDHESLKWLLNQSDSTVRLQRLRLRLQPFDYEINHRPGAKHKAADAISRLATEGLDQTEINDDLTVLMVNNDELTRRPVTFDAETT